MALDFNIQPANLPTDIIRTANFMITPTIESWAVIRGNSKLQSSFNGHKLPEDERVKAWHEMEPFTTSVSAGSFIMAKTEQDKSFSNQDLLLIDYLCNWSPSLLSNKAMGETPDFNEDTKRRGRIVGMINTVEKEFLKKIPNPTEQEWSEFYQKFFKVFDAKFEESETVDKVDWLKTYIIFYSTAWHHRDFGQFKEYDTKDTEGIKYRGMIRAIVNETDTISRKQLLTKLNIISNSSEISIKTAEGKQTSIESELINAFNEIGSLKLE